MLNKVNEIQLSYKESFLTSCETTISSSSKAAAILLQSFDMNTIALQETFKVLLLNNSNKVKGIYTLSIGGITGTLVDIRILYAVILKSLSTAVILCHNHPSGTLKASEQDKEITQKIKKAGLYLDVKVLDHIILSPCGKYFSFADNGLL
ncbi:JAB domain-containing protein [Galbibacter orientalis]|uniref:DNA repair protein n=1 Tax=Galbibacter orientalis DSM 19592 TaxID=926559 RepID=I3C1I6_9FLAO|nr:JAB domain-containing protein [Galbibacter orientalis]EIJ37479.1 DNA repair protein [Galbibacter orientalis DSM 19592]